MLLSLFKYIYYVSIGTDLPWKNTQEISASPYDRPRIERSRLFIGNI